MRIKEIVFDAEHPASLARFWAAAVSGYAVRAYDNAEIARLAALGLTPEPDPTVMVDGPGPSLSFQQRQPLRTGRNPIHLDVIGADRPGEVARLVALGARVREERAGHTVILDPEGDQFCVQDP
ncbi:MAG TPA: VOC family protein [Caulobacteraceae bacterium]